MPKGVSIKFKSYQETVPALLEAIQLSKELKKHDKIILKPNLQESGPTNYQFLEEVLRFCLANKNPVTEVYIAESGDGIETQELFDKYGYKQLSEKYSVGLVDLNEAECQEIQDGEFLRFDRIMYPKILLDSFIISLPKLSDNPETEMNGSLSSMVAAFPTKFYKGFLTNKKNKIRKWPIKYSIHDILKCKMPEFALIDASEQGFIVAGKPLEADKQAAKLIGRDWKTINYLRLLEESFQEKEKKEELKAE